MKKFIPVLAVGALALSMSITGCSGNSNNNSSGGGAWDVNETPAAKVQQGGTFTGSYAYQLTTFNMNSDEGNEQTAILALSAVNPVFWFTDGAGKQTVNPDYVADVKDTVTNGQLVIDLKMNPKASWNDGSPITAADWIATINAMNGTNEDFAVASSDGYDQIQTVVQGADPSEVIFTFKSTYPDWIGVLTYGPMPAAGCTTPDEFNNGWATLPLAWQSGPFMIQSYDPTSGDIVEVPNPNWWGNKPKLDKLTWKLISDGSANTQAFVNQEIDYYDMGLDSDAYAQIKAAPNSVIRTASGPNFRQFTFNSKAPILSDIKVRQAIVMGLDRSQIASSDMSGLDTDPTPLNNNIFLPSQQGFVDLGKKTGIDYNPDGAKKLLEDAGWTMNTTTGFYEKDGKQLDVKFAQLNGVAASANEYLQAQTMLKAIGINLVNQSVDTTKEWPGILSQGNFEIIAFSWMGTPYPLMNVSQIYGTPFASNYAQLTIPTVDNNKDALASEMDPAKRITIGQEDAEAIWNAVHTLPLYQRPELVGVRDKLANIGAPGIARQPYDWTIVGYVS
ncbi:MAG: ABC transporter family substrate-binding protein [Propionibacteriaceae bacterium]|nr:ABC transporter family substrate-binding protein [Propionibacteriaceae bacterium]